MNRRHLGFKILWVSLIGLLIVFKSYAQDVQVKILDAGSLTPVQSVNIFISDASGKRGGERTAPNGLANINGYKFPIRLAVSLIGYQKDTLMLTANNTQWKNYAYYKTVLLKSRSTNLKKTVITGKLRPVLGNNSIYQVNTISETDIAKLAAVNLTDVLQFQMNQFVSNDNILGASNNVGGIGAQNIKILINGVPLNGSEAGFVDLNQININNVKRIETVQGPMSVLYGSNALGGVINIITKESKKKAEFGIRNYVDNLFRMNAAFDVGMRSNKQNFKLSVGRNFFQGWSPEDTLSRWLLWKPKIQYTADLTYRYNLKKGKISLYTFLLNETIENRGVPSITPFKAFAFDEYYLTNRLRNTINFDYQLSQKEYFKSQSTFSNYNRKKNKYYKDMITLESRLTDDIEDHDTSVFNQYHFRGAVNSTRFDKTDLIVGYELNHETSNSSKIADRKQNMTELGLFTTATFDFGQLSIMPSFRINAHSVFKQNYSYGLHLKYSPSKSMHYRASIAQGYRTPNIKELYLEFIDNNHRILGNENLRQEEGLHAEFSGEKKWSAGEDKKVDLVLETNFSYNLLQDKISLITLDASQNKLQYFNIENFSNFISSIRLKFSTENWQGAIGLSRTMILESTGLDANSFGEILLSTHYDIPKVKIGVNWFYRYTANQPIYFVDGGAGLSSPLHVSNLSLTRSFAERIRLQVGVKNVFNIQNNLLSNSAGISPHGSESSTTLLLPRSLFTEILIKL